MSTKKMTYKQLSEKLTLNRVALRHTNDINEKRRLIAEDHEIMVEMNARWERGEMKTRRI